MIRTTRAASRGLTLIEVMIALAILLVGLLGMMQFQIVGIRPRRRAGKHTVATELAQELMAGIELLPFGDPLLADGNIGPTPPTPFGRLVRGDTLTRPAPRVGGPTHRRPGVRTCEIGADHAEYERRWTVWGYALPPRHPRGRQGRRGLRRLRRAAWSAAARWSSTPSSTSPRRVHLERRARPVRRIHGPPRAASPSSSSSSRAISAIVLAGIVGVVDSQQQAYSDGHRQREAQGSARVRPPRSSRSRSSSPATAWTRRSRSTSTATSPPAARTAWAPARATRSRTRTRSSSTTATRGTGCRRTTAIRRGRPGRSPRSPPRASRSTRAAGDTFPRRARSSRRSAAAAPSTPTSR